MGAPRHLACNRACLLACLLFFGVARGQPLTVTLSWDPSSDPTVAGYRVSYGTARGAYSVLLDAGHGSSINVENLDDQTTYYFIVQAYDASARYSPASTEVIYSPFAMTCQN